MIPLSWPTVKDEEINFFDAAPADIKHLNAGIPKAVRQSSAKRWTAQPHIIADRDLSGLPANIMRFETRPFVAYDFPPSNICMMLPFP